MPPQPVPIRRVPLDKIYGYPDRMPLQFPADAHDELLLRSVASWGVLYPLLVTSTDNEQFHLVDGYRRYLAAKMVGMTTMVCRVRPALLLGEDETLSWIIHASAKSGLEAAV